MLGAALGLAPALAGGASFALLGSGGASSGETQLTVPGDATRAIEAWGLDGHGFGPLTFGTSLETLADAGWAVDEDEWCEGSATAPGAPFDTYLTVRGGRVVNALVKNPDVPIVGGIGVGQFLADLRARFPDARQVTRPESEAWVVDRAIAGVLAYFVDRGTIVAVRGAPIEALVFETVACD